MAKMLYVEPAKCTGCRTCELVCSIRNEGVANPFLSRIQVISYKYRGLRIPITCQQCEDPVCSTVCPVNALRRDNALGIVRHDPVKCIGCKQCVATCPFGGVSVNPKTRKVFKCEQCNGKPECARFCEDKAITYVEIDTVAGKKKRQMANDLSKIFEKYGAHPGGSPDSLRK